MSLLHEIIAAFELSDPEKAAQLRNELVAAGGAAPEPAKPPTLLDELRTIGLDSLDLTVSEIPNTQEVPLLLAVVVKALDDLDRRVSVIEPAEQTPTSSSSGAEGEAGGEQSPAPADSPPPNPLVGS